MNENIIKEIRRIIDEGNVVAISGAGISEESGIPTFRGNNGIWKKYNPAIYANIPGLIGVFLFKSSRMRDFILEFYETIHNASPNEAHSVLARMENKGILNSVITQNVDNLHQEAGSKNVVELHGNMLRFRCMRCKKKYKLDEEGLQDLVCKLKKAARSQIIKLLLPRCKCGGRYRPDVVLFGESLPEDEFSKAYRELDKANSILLIGTSGIVYPAASLPFYAKQRKTPIIQINPSHTSFSSIADYTILEKASIALPQIFTS